MAYRTKLGGSTGTFQSMMEGGFGIVTVMNAYVCDTLEVDDYKGLTAYDIANVSYKDALDSDDKTVTIKDKTTKVLCRLDTLKIANVTQEGPTKTVSGGQYSNPLIKFGKSARLEMQDALGRSEAIEALCGGIQEFKGDEASSATDIVGLHFGEDFGGPKMIIGDSFFIDRKSGKQVKVKIIFYQFLPDSIFNLTQDAEGDATVFDMNGDLLTTEIQLHDASGNNYVHGVFYSIVDDNEPNIPAEETGE